MQRRLENGSA